MNTTQQSSTLKGSIAVVTGASRGAGRGIAVELGAAGATVIVTGRSTREAPAQAYAKLLSLSDITAVPGNTAPLFIAQRRGLIVTTTFWDRDRYMKGNLFYGLAEASMTRLAFGIAQELRPHGVASIAVSPGWMRTEFVLAGHHKTDEAHWRERPALTRTESPRYLGRAVAALASDASMMSKIGGAYRVADLADEYGFTDVDGRRVPAFEIE